MEDFQPRTPAPLTAAKRRDIARRLAAGESAPAAAGREASPPADDPARRVRDAVAGRVGLVSVSLPNLAYPLWVRAGSCDAAAAIAAVREAGGGLDLPFLPHRIMVIGDAYLAVALAASYPDAGLVSVEPVPDRARLHALNTLPWRRIATIHNPLGVAGTRLAIVTAPETGGERLVPDPNGEIVTLGFGQVLQHFGWSNADLLVIDPAVCPDLANPAIDADLAAFRRIMIRAGTAGAGAGLAARLPPPAWRAGAAPRHLVFDRAAAGPRAAARRQKVFDLAGDSIACTLPAQGWRPAGETGFCLAPPAGGGDVRLSLRCFAAGASGFEVGLRLLPAPVAPTQLAIGFAAADTGRPIHRAVREIRPGESVVWRFDLPVFFGEVDIVFEAAVAAGDGPGGWLELHDPALL
ncbi:MAG TPA: hypothetical protein PLV07_00175 [Acidiphilium sp.]|nr:hypothetical protein [Acidiphilium sp.]